nr:hypothetical protein 25 [bacterium]
MEQAKYTFIAKEYKGIPGVVRLESADDHELTPLNSGYLLLETETLEEAKELAVTMRSRVKSVWFQKYP